MKILVPGNYISTSTDEATSFYISNIVFPKNSNVTVTLDVANNELFTEGLSNVMPTIEIDGVSPITISDGILSPIHANKKIKLSYTFIGKSKRYLRVKVTQDGNHYYSNTVVLNTFTGAIATIQSKIINKDFRPAFISFHDIYEINNSDSSLDFKVEVCNNANDASPTWENATTAYLNHSVYSFTNKTKTASSYGVRVKITVTKNKTQGTYRLYKMQFIVT